MDCEGSGDGGFLHEGGSGHSKIQNSPCSGMVANSSDKVSSGVTMCSESMFRVDPFYGCGNTWDLLGGSFGENSAMVHPNEFVNPPHSSVLLENQNQAMGSSPHLAHHIPSSSHPGLPEMLPRIPPCLSSETFLDQSGFSNRRWVGTHIQSTNISEDHHCQNSLGRRKRKVPLAAASPQNGEDKQQKDPSVDTPKEEEQNVGQKSQSKQPKDSSNGAETSKENYIHVRAKRGQATNSHSLAERVRRERISERMRLLQELVPGCNKITGKAMMLDEIINYVQSLQQQVEFLSMKLATVNPELNLDIDRILPKEFLHFRGSDAVTPGITSGLNSLHRFPGYPFNGPPATTPLLPPSQHIWNNELQDILHMGFDPDPSACSLGSNGLSKTEL